MVDVRQTDTYAQYLGKIGWKVEGVNNINYFIKSLPLVGSVLKIQRPEKIDLKVIEKTAKKHRAFHVIIEPLTIDHQSLIIKSGYRLSKSPFLPTKTVHLDLTQSKEKLLAQMKKDARYAVRKTNKLQTRNYKLRDIEKFRNTWKKVIGLKRHVPSLKQLTALKEIFGKNVLFLSTDKGNTGAIFLIGDESAYYWQAFTGREGRKTLAQYKIVFDGIMWAKFRGAIIFDFEGIYDERFPNKSWRGFSHFKQSFGGREVEYPGAYTKYPFFDIIRQRSL